MIWNGIRCIVARVRRRDSSKILPVHSFAIISSSCRFENSGGMNLIATESLLWAVYLDFHAELNSCTEHISASQPLLIHPSSFAVALMHLSFLPSTPDLIAYLCAPALAVAACAACCAACCGLIFLPSLLNLTRGGGARLRRPSRERTLQVISFPSSRVASGGCFIPNDLAVDGAGDAVLELQVHLGDGVFAED